MTASFSPSRRALGLTALAGAASALLPRAVAGQQANPETHAVLAPEPVRAALRADAPQSSMVGVQGYPARTLRARKGGKFELILKNGLDAPTAIQIQGSRAANDTEQVAGLNAAPLQRGDTRSVNLTLPDAGTYLYLPALQGAAARQRESGLAGVIIVDEPQPPQVDLDFVAVLDDVRLKPDGTLDETFGLISDAARFGRLGNTLLMNGVAAPQEVKVRPGARIRLRLVSTANARIMPMKFSGGLQTVLAIDGQPCEPFDPLKRAVVMLPGSRYEVMIDAPADAGQDAIVQVDTGRLIPVLTFRTAGAPLEKRGPVQPLAGNDVPASIRLQNAARAEVTIAGGLERDPAKPVPSEDELKKRWPDPARIYQINNGFNSGFAGKPVLTVKRGSPVVLAITNRTAWPQVLTVHGHTFRLLHPLDDGWEPYFLDTLHLPPNTLSRIAFDATNPGKWAIRSTIAEHYDAGVATWFEVTG